MAANIDWLRLLQVTLLEGHNLVLTIRFCMEITLIKIMFCIEFVTEDAGQESGCCSILLFSRD
jgi:hypothetical protein